ncbi:MAG: hypothetical protein ACLP7Q_11430 [Isosphaeraceae bacterium]
MSKDELLEALEMFSDGSGFGDPEARRNAELRLQTILAQRQERTAARLNLLTFMLVVVGLLQAIILGLQVWGR